MYVYEFDSEIYTEDALRETLEPMLDELMEEELSVAVLMTLLSPEVKRRIHDEVMEKVMADGTQLADRREVIQ